MIDADAHNFQILENAMDRSRHFRAKEVAYIPEYSGVYSAWVNGIESVLYVGKASNLKKRINSHFSGQRGSDQFCLYVYDRFVFGCRSELASTREVNALTREWIRDRVYFKVIEVCENCLATTESTFRRRWKPLLNPLP